MTDDTEPEVLLPGGRHVPAAIYLGIRDLQSHGRHVRLLGDRVLVSPPAHPDALWMLQASWHDVQAVLEDDAAPRRPS